MNDSPITLPEIDAECSPDVHEAAAVLGRHLSRFRSLSKCHDRDVAALRDYGIAAIDLPSVDKIAHNAKKKLVAEAELRNAVIAFIDMVGRDTKRGGHKPNRLAKSILKLQRSENELALLKLRGRLSTLRGKLDSAGKRRAG